VRKIWGLLRDSPPGKNEPVSCLWYSVSTRYQAWALDIRANFVKYRYLVSLRGSKDIAMVFQSYALSCGEKPVLNTILGPHPYGVSITHHHNGVAEKP